MAVMSMMLPYELVGMIIDYFETDKTELAKCTLIARSWLLPSRYHLFRTLTITQSREHDGLAAFRRFLESSRGQSSAAYTQILRLRGIPPDDEEYWEPTLDLYELGAVVHKLSRLSVVDLDYVRLSGLPTDGPAPETCKSVELIHFARITTWTFHDLKDCMDVLHLFPGLKKFLTNDRGRHVNDTGRVYTEPPPTDYRPFSPKLQMEQIAHTAFGPCSPLLDYIAQAFNLSNLTSLTLWHVLPQEVRSLGRFLAAVKHSLRFLSVSLVDCLIEDSEDAIENPQQLWQAFEVSKCEVLSTFILYVRWDFDPDQAGPALDFHPHWLSVELILAQLPPCIQHIEIALEDVDDASISWYKEVLRDVMWNEVSSSLLRLPKLKSVRFYSEHRWVTSLQNPVEPWMERLLRRKLSEVDAKGMLDFAV